MTITLQTEYIMTKLRGIWEGSLFVRQSYSMVNMSLTNILLDDRRLELSLVPYEVPTVTPSENPSAYSHLAQALNRPLSGPANFHVRLMWPPDLSKPASGHLFLIQPWEFGRIPKDWVKQIQQNVDEIWAPTTYVKQCFIKSGIDSNRIRVIPHGVDCHRFHPDIAPLKIDTNKKFKFLFVGGAIYRKGIDILLTAYQQAFTATDDVCLVIKGIGANSFYQSETIDQLIYHIQSEPSAPEIIYLTEEFPDANMASLYTACDCLILPYRGEGFGMPVAEAMACKIPVIVTKGGATDDFCDDDTAFLVESKRKIFKHYLATAGSAWLLEPDIDSLIEQMKKVIGNPEKAKIKSYHAMQHVRKHMTWQQAAGMVIERIETICNTQSSTCQPSD
jgi:glycosyltransferase involved in cell wall biosynthesis